MNILKRTPVSPKTSMAETKIAPMPKPRGGSKWLVGTLIVLLLATGYLSYQLYQLKANPSAQGQKELDQIIKKVGKLVILPEGETPTLATVTDPEKLKNQPFFANAKTGYKVLLYSQAQKAILYDPVSNKIVEIAPINPTATQTPTDQSTSSGTTTDSTSTPSKP